MRQGEWQLASADLANAGCLHEANAEKRVPVRQAAHRTQLALHLSLKTDKHARFARRESSLGECI